jgi:hypothetical protein
MDATFATAVDLLESAHITFGAAAHLDVDGQKMATFLFRSETDRNYALEILAAAGLQVKSGANGF